MTFPDRYDCCVVKSFQTISQRGYICYFFLSALSFLVLNLWFKKKKKYFETCILLKLTGQLITVSHVPVVRINHVIYKVMTEQINL